MEKTIAHKTIPHVLVTPVLPVKIRGKELVTHQPKIGSIVTMMDTGFASSVGSSESFVVTTIKKNKMGTVHIAGLSRIISITSDTVTYNPSNTFPINLYCNQETEGWAESPTHDLYDYEWDVYKNTIIGDMK